MIKAITNFHSNYLAPQVFEDLSSKVQHAAYSLEAARILSETSDLLVDEAVKATALKFSDKNLIEKSNYSPESEVNFKQAIKYFLKIITYSLVAGDTGPIDNYLISELNEIKNNFDLFPCYIEALKYIRDNNCLSKNVALEANIYFDDVIDALS